jgi:dihydropteroate synthase
MGIVNVTPDSFSDGGNLASAETALAHALKLIEQGADILDIGGESTRPGATPVSEDEEMARVIPLIAALRAEWAGPISIDTMKPQVARAAVAAGATIWNDVTALCHAPDSLQTAVDLGCDVILMHMQGVPQTMQDTTTYEDVVPDVIEWLGARADKAISAGVRRDRLWLDPGIGFGKAPHHNLALTAGLHRLAVLGFPILYGASRKRVIQIVDDSATDPLDRLGGSIALALEAARQGADIIRVHDVRQTVQALKMQAALREL